MKRTNFDRYLEEQMKDPAFAARFERASGAWDAALPSEYCSHCKKVTVVNVAVTHRTITGPDGTASPIVIRTYHCGSCGLFVRSEKEEPCIVAQNP